MLQRCACLRHVVSRSSIAFASSELNKLLVMTNGQTTVQPTRLKQFLSGNVTPILEGTALDRRDGDGAAARRLLAQLIRDCAFSANVLRARPEGRFVRTLVDCIRCDGARMQFMKRVSSGQAAKITEMLCKVGVRDSTMYPMLVAKLDFHNLKDIARVMFAFAEADLHELNVTVVAPLYCGETWTLTYESPPGLPAKPDNASCNAYEAVRVLRALSKSTRAVVEAYRRDPRKGPVPLGSIAQLRNELLHFLLENAGALRGAHWTNVARALVNFPAEAQSLQDGLTPASAPVMAAAIEAARASRAEPVRSGGPTCNDLALFCIDRVFARAEEEVKALGDAGGEGEAGRAHTPTPLRRLFDLTQLDLVKLLPLLRQVPCSPAVRDARFATVFAAIGDGLQEMQFGGLVQLIHTMRQIEGSRAFPADAIGRIAREAGARLAALPVEDVLAEIPLRRIVQFASQLTAFRVRDCPGFISFLVKGARLLPPAMSPETAAVLLSALTTVLGKRGVDVTADVREAVLAIVANTIDHDMPCGARHGVEDSLLYAHPLPCVKILRSMVLLDVLPSADVIHAVFGREGTAQMSGALQQGGAILLFDLSRSLMHLCRQARAAASPPGRAVELLLAASAERGPRLPDSQADACQGEVEVSVEELLWSRGMRHTVMPLLEMHTMALTKSYAKSLGVNVSANSYVPVCWRSCMESATVYVDVTLDTRKNFDQMAGRVLDMFGPAQALAEAAVSLLYAQCANLREAADSPAALHRLFSKAPFSSNATVHALAFLLAWEYLLYQAAWEARRVLARSAPAAETTSAASLEPGTRAGGSRARAEEVLARKADFDAFLERPFTGSFRQDLSGVTPLRALSLVFSAEEFPALARGLAPGVADEPILQRGDVFEITTHLPFAISLVMEPGPVNELFSSRSVSLVLGSDESLAGTEETEMEEEGNGTGDR